MNVRTIALLVAALSTAGGTAFFAKNWIAGQRRAMEAQAPAQSSAAALAVTEVLVAKKDLAAGTFVKPDMLRWQPWPEDGVHKDFLIKGEASEKNFEGAVVRSRLMAGEPITMTRVVQPGEQGFLAAVLEPGKRAVSVPVNASSGVAGLVFPGDLVDVIMTFKTSVKDESTEESLARFFSETLLTEIRVLAIDQRVDHGDADATRVAKTATLEVTPKQAEIIAIGMELGSLSLSLHSLANSEADGQHVAAAEGLPATPAKPADRYTRDMDVLYMLGQPGGLPALGSEGAKAMVLRGNQKPEEVKF